jgi:hypothetical protein
MHFEIYVLSLIKVIHICRVLKNCLKPTLILIKALFVQINQPSHSVSSQQMYHQYITSSKKTSLFFCHHYTTQKQTTLNQSICKHAQKLNFIHVR